MVTSLLSLVTMKFWAIMAFAIVILALVGVLDVGTAFYMVIALTAIGFLVLRVGMMVPMLQFAVSLLILIGISGGAVEFGAAMAASPVTAMLAGVG